MRWTQVSRSQADSPEGRRALADLCAAYYEPVLTFLRCQLREPQEAEDVANDFFRRMLEGGAIDRADQAKGRFRSYLLGAVKHFLSHHREAARRLKRGGGVEDVSLHDTETGQIRPLPDERALSPDEAFDRHNGYPDELRVNGTRYDLHKGRVFVLNEDGTLDQVSLEIPLPLATVPAVVAELIDRDLTGAK